MFKNESKVIRRMLESCYQYIDYWVVQDNGSTDGTDQIVKDFFEEKGVPGHYYQCEEGWVGFGWNRDHLLQTCLNHDHGCDWILKMDCDEYLEVDDDFDWSLIDDTNIQSFHITAENPGCTYYRAWMWNARLPWHLSMMSHMNVLFVILMELVKTSSVLIFREVSVKWEPGMEKAMLHPPNISATL